MPSLGVHTGMVILSSRFKVQGSKLVNNAYSDLEQPTLNLEP